MPNLAGAMLSLIGEAILHEPPHHISTPKFAHFAKGSHQHSTSSKGPRHWHNIETVMESDELAVNSGHHPRVRFNALPLHSSPRRDEITSVWDYPGLEKDTFYAFASYIRQGQRTIPCPTLSSHPQTQEVTRNFLDRLADCFAWTKRRGETAEHVTATAILHDNQRQKHKVLIAKNVLHPPHETNFATEFFAWLNSPPKTPNLSDDKAPGENTDSGFWCFLATHSRNRLEHYITQLLDASKGIPEERLNQEDWYLVKNVILHCKGYDFKEGSVQKLGECAELALEARRDVFFGSLRNARDRARQLDREQGLLSGRLSTIASEKTPEDKLLEGIQFLGRLRSSYEYFLKFRHAERGTYFEHEIICADPASWDGRACLEKTKGWANFIPRVDRSNDFIGETIKEYGDRGSVHCEMQLLCYFIRNEFAFPDYVGCSKKACALCQHVLVSCQIHASDQHNFIYPRWSLPKMDFGERTHLMAAGLMSAYISMLSVIQESIRTGKMPAQDYGVMHTSARNTRRHTFSRAKHVYSDTSNPQITLYSAKDREHVGSVPAIHFPRGDRSEPRVVRIRLYERNEDDVVEFNMHSFNFDGKNCVTAIQLRDKFIDGKTLDRESEFHKCNWLTHGIIIDTSHYYMLCRISEELGGNSCLWDIVNMNEQRLQAQGVPTSAVMLSEERDFPNGEAFVFHSTSVRQLDDIAFDLKELRQRITWTSLPGTSRKDLLKKGIPDWNRLCSYRDRILQQKKSDEEDRARQAKDKAEIAKRLLQ